jgi:hypothetical protein
MKLIANQSRLRSAWGNIRNWNDVNCLAFPRCGSGAFAGHYKSSHKNLPGSCFIDRELRRPASEHQSGERKWSGSRITNLRPGNPPI